MERGAARRDHRADAQRPACDLLDPLRDRLVLHVGRVRPARRCALRRPSVDADLCRRCLRHDASRLRAPRRRVALARRGVPVSGSARGRARLAARARRRARSDRDRRATAVVRPSTRVVLRRRKGPRVLHESRSLPGRVGIAGLSPPSGRRSGLGAGRVTRVRNFSNWAYWQLHLEALADPDRPSDLDAWRTRTRATLGALLGPDPAPVPLDVETTESVDCGTYQRERVVFDTERAMSVPAFLLVPHTRLAAPPGPAVLALHGHGPGKSLVCGIESGGPGDDYAHQLAAAGYVVLAPDLRAFGERADWMPPDKYQCDWDLVCATMAGVVPLARNLWDLRRAVDVLVGHPLVDPTRIATVGLSYGATCTLFLTAL